MGFRLPQHLGRVAAQVTHFVPDDSVEPSEDLLGLGGAPGDSLRGHLETSGAAPAPRSPRLVLVVGLPSTTSSRSPRPHRVGVDFLSCDDRSDVEREKTALPLAHRHLETPTVFALYAAHAHVRAPALEARARPADEIGTRITTYVSQTLELPEPFFARVP